MDRTEWYKKEAVKIDSLDLTNQLEQQEFKNLVKGYLHLTTALLDFIEKNKIVTEDSPEFILTQGRYKGGIDIPCGVYDLEAIPDEKGEYGYGSVETKRPDDQYCHLVINKPGNKSGNNSNSTYTNFEVTDKSFVRIEADGISVAFRRHAGMV